MGIRYADKLGAKHRNAYRLMTSGNAKTVKGEAAGYLTAILYLAPHTLGGGATLCPHSTLDCRTMCLAGSGMSGLPLQLAAKLRRTHLFNTDRVEFLRLLAADVARLRAIAAKEGLRPALRLNGTSDVMWERVWPEAFCEHADLQFYDYTKIPLEHRAARLGNLHLTYSYMGPQDAERAVNYLAAGHSVAAVVPLAIKDELLSRPDHRWPLVDGDHHDLRFLDPPGSVVLLKPKGHIRTGLVRPDVLRELAAVA